MQGGEGSDSLREALQQSEAPSADRKTLVVASTRGNAVTTAMVDGKPVTIGRNGYIKP